MHTPVVHQTRDNEPCNAKALVKGEKERRLYLGNRAHKFIRDQFYESRKSTSN